jgi:ArsR family transcriptional regulator
MTEDLEIFRACADATRLRLLVLLSERELCVCDLVDVLEMPQGKISRHLAVLRRAGLV